MKSRIWWMDSSPCAVGQPKAGSNNRYMERIMGTTVSLRGELLPWAWAIEMESIACQGNSPPMDGILIGQWIWQPLFHPPVAMTNPLPVTPDGSPIKIVPSMALGTSHNQLMGDFRSLSLERSINGYVPQGGE